MSPVVSTQHSDEETQRTRMRYDRIAPVYDRIEALAEHFWIRHRRSELWKYAVGPEILELGVGTGKNVPFYPDDVQMTALDLSPVMLAQARKRVEEEDLTVDLILGDAQELPFTDGSFNTVIASFVFCSVPDPIRGLQEAKRVLVPGGQLLLLEHVLSQKRILKPLMRIMNPAMVRLTGANFNRETLRNIEAAGFEVQLIENLWSDIVKLIVARRKEMS